LPAGFQHLAGLSGNAPMPWGWPPISSAGQAQGSFAPTGFQAGSQFLNLMLNPNIEGRSGFGAAAAPAPLAYAEQQSSALAASAFSTRRARNSEPGSIPMLS
jgi:hypothetical protein